MFGFGILSGLTFLPLVGAALILFVPGDDSEAAKTNIRWIALWTTLVVFGLSLYAWAHFTSGVRGVPVRRAEELVRLGPDLQARRGRHFLPLRGADRLPDALLHRRLLEFDRHPRQGIHDRVPGAGNADDRRVLRARPGAVLPVLRGRVDSDVHHHRRLGRQAAHLRQLQVLPLYAGRLAADAHRHTRDVFADPHHGHH